MKARNDIDFVSAARAVNLLDPAAAQDAATKAYVDGLLGWKDLAIVTLTAVNSVDFAPIGQAYSDLRLVFDGVSHNSGSNQQYTLATSADGSTFSSAANVTGTFAGSATIYGSLELPGYRLDGGAIAGATANLAASPGIAGGGALNPVWRCTGGIHGLRIAITGGATFDGGKLRLQARI